MKKQIITIIITAIIVSLLDFGIFYLCKDKLFKDNNPSTTENEENKDFTSKGTYIVTYTDKAEGNISEDTPSILTINEDKTYEFLYNRCDSMITIKGKYEVKDNTLTLVDSKKTLSKDKDLTFTIVDDSEIYLNDWLSCVIEKEAYDNGYGSFKKVN